MTVIGGWLQEWTGWAMVLGALVGPADTDPACTTLGRLDLARAHALTTLDANGLRAVHVDPSRAAEDLRLAQAYAERGLALHAGAMTRLRCDLVDHGPDRVRLDVVERLGRSWVITSAGERRDLPVDRPERHLIELRRVDGQWRIGTVETVDQQAPR